MRATLQDPSLLERFWFTTRDMVLLARDGGRFVDINPRAMETLGWSEAELESIDLTAVIHADDQAETMAAKTDLLVGKPIEDREIRIRCKDGSWKWLSWSADLRDAELFVVARDITDRKCAETLRMEALEAEARLRHQRLLLNAASHELNTPLTPMLFDIARLQRHGDPDVVRTARALDRSSRRLQLSINALLTVADLNCQHIKAKLRPTDIQALLGRVARQEGLSVRPEGTMAACECDEAFVEQAVRALVQNAQSHGGGVTGLRASVRQDRLRIEVEDAGPGIDGDPEALFMPMHRGGPAGPSAGLGLTTVRLVAEAHHGDAGITQGDATVAWLEIPQTTA